jgi:hypothetical protein
MLRCRQQQTAFCLSVITGRFENYRFTVISATATARSSGIKFSKEEHKRRVVL